MKTPLLRLIAAGLIALSFAPGSSASESSPDAPAEVAVDFINAYVSFSRQPDGGDTTAFVKSSPVVTERFKEALEKLYRDALKEDPELGYSSDAVIGGQDSADRFGVKSSRVQGERARVVLVGVEPPDFPMEVKVDLVRENGQWLIDASGDLVKD